MFSTYDTIVAIATPPGRGGIGVVRVSGPEARGVAEAILSVRDPLVPRYATFTHVRGTAPAAAAKLREAQLRPEPVDGSTVLTVDPEPAEWGERSTSEASACGSRGGGAPRESNEEQLREGVGPREHVREEDTTTFLDQVVATYFQAPASYTGEDVVEISGHGSPVVLRQILNAAMQAGARLAEPGEFTLRAFLNGRLDLVQAEAVADLIDAVTPLQARAAYDQLEGTLTGEIGEIDAGLFDLAARFEASVDFPEEGYHFVEPGAAAAEIAAIDARLARLLADARRGRVIREGATVAIGGKPNVGKSSLFNALVGTSRAIVTPTPGTTRDFITELTDLQGLRITLVDTAGDRAGQDEVDEAERAGLERARGARSVAELVLVVLDRSRPLDDIDRSILEQTAAMRRLLVINKSDLPEVWPTAVLSEHSECALPISVRTGEGLDRLRSAIARALIGGGEAMRDTAAVTNVRHIELLGRARDALVRARRAIDASQGLLSEEFVLADLQAARNAFEEITGKRTADDLLEHIFSRFCIGK